MNRHHVKACLWGSGSAFALWGFVFLPGYEVWLGLGCVSAMLGAWIKNVRPNLSWTVLGYFLTGLAGMGWLLNLQGETLAFGSAQFAADMGFRKFCRLLLAAHSHSLAIAIVGSLSACFFGVIMGGVLGMSSGWLARILKPMLQTLMAIPIMLYLLVGLVIFPPGPATLILVFGMTLWLEPARMVQARLASLRKASFVHVARTLGAGEWRILWKECRPNIMPVIWVSFLIVFLNAILLESILGFLGLGLSPGTPSLGKFIEEGGKAWPQYPQYLLGPLLLEIAWMLGLRGIMRAGDRRNQPLRIA